MRCIHLEPMKWRALLSGFSHGAVPEMWIHCGKLTLDKAYPSSVTSSVWGMNMRTLMVQIWPCLEYKDVMCIVCLTLPCK